MEYTKLYFYSNQNFVRDIFTSNVISCSASSKKERAASFGTADTLSLFLTHKKLKRDLRAINLSPQDGDFPVLVEVSVPKNKELEVLLVSKQGEEYAVAPGKISEYNPELHIGCFWRGFIPFTFISGFLFENETDRKDIWVPSPDIWTPEALFRELNDAEFTDELVFEKLQHCFTVLPQETQTISNEEIVRSAVSFNKFRAMLYYAVRSTQNWFVGKYRLNADAYVLDILGIDREKAASDIKQMIDAADQSSVLPADLLLPLKGDVFSSDADPRWKAVHDTIVKELLRTDVTTTFDQQYFYLLRDAVLSAAVSAGGEEFGNLSSAHLEAIDATLYQRKGLSLEALLSRLSDALPLKALLFLLKCPHPANRIEDVLPAYRTDCITTRIAMVYFAAVNGFADLPGEEKSRLRINLAIDRYAAKQLSSVSALPCAVNSDEEYAESLPEAAKAGFEKSFAVSCSRVTTWEEIHAFFSGENGLLRLEETAEKMWLASLLDCYGRSGMKRLRIQKDTYVYYEVDTAALKNRILSSEFDSLTKSTKAVAFVRNLYVPKFKSAEFFSDFIVPREKFSKMYAFQPEFWQGMFKKRTENVKQS